MQGVGARSASSYPHQWAGVSAPTPADPAYTSLVQHIHSRLAELKQRKEVLHKYLLVKLDEWDLHGIEDAASDLRDIESAMENLKKVLEIR